MHPSESTPRTIGQYRIVSSIKQFTLNQIFVVEKLSSPNQPLYVLKIYKSEEGYLREKEVFGLQALYKNYFVQACDQGQYEGRTVQYTVCNYSNCESLKQFGMLLRHFPLEAVKFYMRDLLTKLHFIHYEKKIKFRTLYVTDVILNKAKELFIVGWSKEKPTTTEEELLYDCGEIMFYMLTNGAFQEIGIGFKGQEKKRFLTEEFWDIEKKKNYLKFFPTDQEQLELLVSFLFALTVRNKLEPITLAKILKHPFLTQPPIPTFQQISQQVTTKQMKILSQQKEKELKNFEIKIKRAARIMSMGTRSCSEDYQVIRSPFLIPIRHKSQGVKECEHNQIEGYCQQQLTQKPQLHSHEHSRQKLPNLLQKFFTTKLQQNLKGPTIFSQDWITIIQFQIEPIPSPHPNLLTYSLACQIRFQASEDFVHQKQQVVFTVQVELNEREEVGGSCVRGLRVRAECGINQILLGKFQGFLGEGLVELFRFCQT